MTLRQSTLVICSECEGKGYVEKEERTTFYDSEWHKIICPKCNGHRVVEKEVLTTFKPISEIRLQTF